MSNASDRIGEAGIGFLQLKIPKLLGYIFRPLPMSDYGIDGEIEITDDQGAAIGRLIATQVKTGPSHFENETKTGYIFRGERRHLDYWQYHSLPVIVVLVNLDADVAYWVEVDTTAVTTGVNWKIEVPKRQVLDIAAKVPLRDIANKLADEVAMRAQKDYEAIRETYLEGRRQAAFAELDARVKQPSWRFAPRTLQAEAFRSLGLWSFVRTRDASATEAFLLQAQTADKNSDETVVRAMMEALTNGPEAALPLLDAPATAGAMNIRALFLALSGRAEEAAGVLAAWPTDLQRSAETTRIEALVAYIRCDLARARERIAAAMAEKPRWLSVRETHALIEYASSLPPSELPDLAQPFPLPVPPVLLRHDDASLEHLRAAAAAYGEVLATADDEDDRKRFELWRLAALANDPSAREKAKSVAAQALTRSKLSGPLLAWVLQRALIDDLGGLTDRLLAEVAAMDVETARTEPGLVFLAAQTLVGNLRREEARTLLERLESALLEQNADALHYWRARIAMEDGDAVTAAAEAALITNAEMRAEAGRAADGATDGEEPDWRTTSGERFAAYRTNGDAAALFDAIRIHATHEDWDVVLDTADDLFGLLPNLAVLETICQAAWRKGRYRLCLEWLDKWLAVSSMRTEALDQTRVACLIRIDPLAAAEAARALLLAYPSSENVVRAMTAFLRIGDLKSLSIEARRLLKDETIDSGTLLNAAQMTALEDHDLAVALFRKAITLGIDDDHVGTAVSLAHQLGQDHATATLAPRMQQLGAERRGGITAMSLPEVLEYATSHQERVADILAKFYAAEIPIHGVARSLGWTLAEVFHLWSAENRDEPSVIRHRPLLTRFGGLAPPRAERMRGKELAMDITAFLLAADLELLDDVERSYAPIRVSRYLPAAIFEQQRRLGDVQPSRLEMFERVKRLVDSGKVKVLDTSTENATLTGDSSLDAFLGSTAADMRYVEQLPITDHEMRPITLAPDVATRVVSLSDVLAAARRDAVVDDDAFREVVVGLPPANAEPASIPDRIVLSDLAATTLAGSGALEQIATTVEVHVLPRVVEEARSSLVWAGRRRDISSWLERLRERLRQGLENGVYVATGDADIEVDDVRDLDFETLRDLLQEGNDGRAVWIEDRACSRIAGSFVGIGDVLADLRDTGAISGQTHAALGHKLREGDVRYLPLDRDDLVLFASAAQTRKLPDTKELQTVSRYVARIALDGNRSNGTEGVPPEIAAVFDSSRVTASVVPEIWKIHRDDPTRAAEHAGWFMNHIYAGRLAVRASTEPHATTDVAREDTAADLAQLYMGALIVALREFPDRWEGSITEEYIHWVSSAFALRKFFTDPDLVHLTGRYLAALAKHFTAEFDARDELKALDALLSPVFMLMPTELRHAWLVADPEFGERHGYRVGEGVQINGRSVPADAFWSGLEDALANRTQPDNAQVRVSFREEFIEVMHEEETLRIEDPLFLVFAHGESERCARWAESHGEMLDMPKAKRVAEAGRIGALVSARERVFAADTLRGGGARVFYHSLAQRLRSGGTIPESEFRLSAAALADHFRWVGGDGAAASDLIGDVGIEEALQRLITLPTRLPDAVVGALGAAAGRTDIIRRTAKNAVAPLSMIHAAALALRFAEESGELLKVGGELVDRLLSPEYEETGYEAFERAFAATNSWLSFDSTSGGLAAEDRLMLAMSHASRLLDTIGDSQLRKAAEFFATVAALPRESLSRDPGFFDHVLYPTNLDYARFVVTGLAITLRDVPTSLRETAGIPAKLQSALTRLKESHSIGGFFKDVTLCQQVTPTLFDGEAREAILEVAHEAPFEIPTAADLAKALTEVLERADEQPEAFEWWIPVQAIVQQHPLRSGDSEHVRSIVCKLADEATRRKIPDRNLVMSLSCLAGPIAATSEDGLRQQFANIYLAAAREFGAGTRDASLLAEVGPAFLEIALALSARAHDPVASARELAKHVDDLIRVWPALAQALASRLGDLVWTTPVDQSVPLWRIVLRARENPR